MIAKTVLSIFALLLLLQECDAQDQFRRVEAFLALGRHFVLNDDLSPPAPDSDGYVRVHLLYNFTETQSIGVSYGSADYQGLLRRVGSSYDYEGARYSTWISDLYATYRHSWRKRQPLRIYFEIGLGISEAVQPYDTGNKFAMCFAVGLKRFVGEHFSLSIESRRVRFRQKKYPTSEVVESPPKVTMAINEFTLVLGYLF